MTHLELLNRLPSPYREQAIENNTAEYLDSSKHKKLATVLAKGFAWCDSPQKFRYWSDVWKRAAAGEFDPPQNPSVTLPREDWEVVEKAIEYTLDYILIQDVDRLPFERIREAIQSQLNPKQ